MLIFGHDSVFSITVASTRTSSFLENKGKKKRYHLSIIYILCLSASRFLGRKMIPRYHTLPYKAQIWRNYKVTREGGGKSVRLLPLWCKNKSLEVLSMNQPSDVLFCRAVPLCHVRAETRNSQERSSKRILQELVGLQ